MLACGLEAKTEDIKNQIEAEHTIISSYVLRYYVKNENGKSERHILKAEQSLAACGIINGPVTFLVVFNATAEKQRERRKQAKETAKEIASRPEFQQLLEYAAAGAKIAEGMSSKELRKMATDKDLKSAKENYEKIMKYLGKEILEEPVQKKNVYNQRVKNMKPELMQKFEDEREKDKVKMKEWQQKQADLPSTDDVKVKKKRLREQYQADMKQLNHEECCRQFARRKQVTHDDVKKVIRKQ